MLFQDTSGTGPEAGVEEERAQGQAPGPRAPRKLSWGDRGPGGNPGTLAVEPATGVRSGGLGENSSGKNIHLLREHPDQCCRPVSDTHSRLCTSATPTVSARGPQVAPTTGSQTPTLGRPPGPDIPNHLSQTWVEGPRARDGAPLCLLEAHHCTSNHLTETKMSP